jgi:O-antigen ligase
MEWVGAIGGIAKRAALPAFFIVLVVLGGASRGAFYANAALQIVSAGVIAWCLIDPRLGRFTPAAWQLVGLAVCLAAISLLQLVPLPPEIWSSLPGRQIVVDGFAAMDADLPWLPMSMAPDDTLFGVLKFLPAFAAFTLAAKLTPRSLTDPLGWTVALVATATVAIGLGQIFGGRESPLYFHDFTNWGSPVGFMANVNHQATLLLISIPFGAVVVSRLLINAQLGDRSLGLGLIVIALLSTAILGVMIAGSTAGYGLLVPAILLSFLIGRGEGSGSGTVIALFGVSLVVGILAAVVASSPRLVGLGFTDLSGGSLGRPDTYARTLQAISDTMPFGSGLGSFEALFPSYEDPAQVSSTFMNHAHNDYLEVALEYGAAGVLLIAIFLVWFVWRSIAIWRAEGEDGSRLRKAASVAVLIVILHSIVDYPLRTGAISGFVGLGLGIMVARSEPPRKRRQLALPQDAAQHVTI